MAKGINCDSTFDYVLKAEKEKENKTIWKLSILPSFINASLLERADKEPIKVAYETLQHSLKGWENFDIEFQTEKIQYFGEEYSIVPISVLGKLKIEWISELYLESMRLNSISEEEAKN